MLRYSLPVSLLLSLLFVNAFATTNLNYKFKKTFQSTAGVVVFDHESHATGRTRDCAECHSALKAFGGEINELFAHNFCKLCHESNRASSECNGCHSEQSLTASEL